MWGWLKRFFRKHLAPPAAAPAMEEVRVLPQPLLISPDDAHRMMLETMRRNTAYAMRRIEAERQRRLALLDQTAMVMQRGEDGASDD